MNTLQLSGSTISSIVEKEALDNGMSELPSLLNQGSFLSFSYTCIVWLWESAKKGKYEEALLDELNKACYRFI